MASLVLPSFGSNHMRFVAWVLLVDKRRICKEPVNERQDGHSLQSPRRECSIRLLNRHVLAMRS